MKWNPLYFTFALFCITICACQSKQIPPPTTFTYLALGDSYTIGESVADSLRWPNQLVAELNKTRQRFESATIIAKTGWPTDELATAMDKSTLTATYDYVSLLIGVNNQYRGRSVENFREEFTQLLDRSIALSGENKEKVFVLSIPDWGVTPFAEGRNRNQIAQEIDRFNTAIAEVCRNYEVAYFDITPISRKATTSPNLIAQDGLHPSGIMYAQWVEIVLPFFNTLTND